MSTTVHSAKQIECLQHLEDKLYYESLTSPQHANRTRRTITNRKQFWLSGSPEVITDGAIRQKTKLPIFSFPGTICLSRVVLELRRKTKFQKKKVGCYGNVPWKIKNRGSGSSTAIAPPSGKNRVKIRPVEVEIIWLTEIVKNIWNTSKNMATR